MKLADFSAIVSEGSSLTEDQAAVVADLLASGEEDPVEKADFLTKLANKGESFQEVAGLPDDTESLLEIQVWANGAPRRSTFAGLGVTSSTHSISAPP